MTAPTDSPAPPEDPSKAADPQRLQDEADRLMGIVLPASGDAKYPAARKAALDGWLSLFAALYAAIDPRFDPESPPLMKVEAPPVGGVKFPPGIDPSAIKDPAARAEYTQKIAENERKIRDYNLQIKLRRLEEKLRPRLRAFVDDAYPAPEDKPEVNEAIQSHIPDATRAAALRKLLGP